MFIDSLSTLAVIAIVSSHPRLLPKVPYTTSIVSTCCCNLPGCYFHERIQVNGQNTEGGARKHACKCDVSIMT